MQVKIAFYVGYPLPGVQSDRWNQWARAVEIAIRGAKRPIPGPVAVTIMVGGYTTAPVYLVRPILKVLRSLKIFTDDVQSLTIATIPPAWGEKENTCAIEVRHSDVGPKNSRQRKEHPSGAVVEGPEAHRASRA